jgi:hypothetical protein
MRLRSLAIAAAAATLTLSVPTTASAAPGTDFTSTASLSGCSASVVRFADSQPNEQALMITAGHCHEFLQAGQVLVNKSSRQIFELHNPDGSVAGTTRASRILYGTMTKTDIMLYQLRDTYADLQSKFGVPALTLAQNSPAVGTGIAVVSAYWKRIFTCSVEEIVYEIREGVYTWKNSIQYHQPGCEVLPGTSGSPVIDTTTGQVVGINNTRYENGTPCTLNNPCEADANGNTHVETGAAYGQQSWWLYTCITAQHTIDLNRPGCLLPS